jgi:hypothetical protein
VNLRVKSLNTSIEALGGSSVFTDIHDFKSSLAKSLGGSSSGKEVNIFGCKKLAKVYDSSLIGNRDECTSGWDNILLRSLVPRSSVKLDKKSIRPH